MSDVSSYIDYGFRTADPSHVHQVFMPPLFDMIGDIREGTRVLDVGCGNGFLCAEFAKRGCEVIGIDLGEGGIEVARQSYPGIRFEVEGAGDDLLQRLDTPPFDIVVSTEVVEHLYSPHTFMRGCHRALQDGGRMFCTTPYHGYLKNLCLSVLNKWDSHATPLWEGGHIKLWSRRTLEQLFKESGFSHMKFRGAGRLPYLWMTMVMSGVKSAEK